MPEQIPKQVEEPKVISGVKQALSVGEGTDCQRHEVLLYVISTLTAKLSIPPPCHSFYLLFILLFLSLVSTPV